MNKPAVLSLACTIALGLSACQQEATPVPAAPTESAGLTQLPISTNAAMVGMVDQSADYIWAVGNGDMPGDDHDWDQVRGAVYSMILGGAVMKVPGNGENDAAWAASEDWRALSDSLTRIGQDALPLVQSRSTDVAAWRLIGDRLVENCEACHAAYKPDIPSQGIMHEATTREASGTSIFD